MADDLHNIGPYTVQRELGRGGMGVVYLGRDTRLDRDVAIKALPEQLAADPDRLARFEREAKTLAQLNHPNVAGIYGLEVHENAKYLVLEYVEGETLADRLDRGPLPVDEALEIAVQIASGVEAAHDAGVIHRDLKPGNVIVTPDGKAKVLDFGLARSDEPSNSSAAISDYSTLVSPAQHSPTIPGAILGTAAYMSPEQARGRTVDRRTDIWSYGVVLFEMLTGASPFVGETVSDSIGAVLHKNVDLSLLPSETPPSVRRVLRRCVERDRSLRFRDVGDVRVELLRSRDETEDVDRVEATTSWSAGRWGVVAALLVACLAGGWFGAVALRPEASAPVGKFDVVVESEELRLRDAEPKISPDGTLLAFIQNKQIRVREIDSFDSRALPETDGAVHLFWSPDGTWIGYHTKHAIFKVSLTGGGSIRLTGEGLTLGNVCGGGWTADDRIVFSDDDDGIVQVSARGGEPTELLPLDSGLLVDYHDVSVIPGTETVLYILHRRDMSYAVAAFDGERQVVVAEMEDAFLSDPVYSASGHVLFVRAVVGTSVWAIAFDLDRMEPKGEPFLVESESGQPSVSSDGTLAILRGNAALGGSFAWVTSCAGDVEPIEGEFDVIFAPMLSPDSSRLAFTAGTSGKLDVWVRDLDRGVSSRVTFVEGMVGVAGWSPDGREIAVNHFLPAGEVPGRTMFHSADGSGESRPAIDGMLSSFDASWRTATFIADPTVNDQVVFSISLDDPADRTPVLTSDLSFRGLSLSPDGSLLLYTSEESGDSQVYCTGFPDGSGKWQVSTKGGRNAVWAADGGSLFFESTGEDEAIYEVEATREPSLRFGVPTKVIDGDALRLDLEFGWTPSPDGERFIIKRAAPEAAGDRTTISVVQNWFEAHRDR